jgi:hypothetical protein
MRNANGEKPLSDHQRLSRFLVDSMMCPAMNGPQKNADGAQKNAEHFLSVDVVASYAEP